MKSGKHLEDEEKKDAHQFLTLSSKGQPGGNVLWFARLLHSLTWQMQNTTLWSWGCSHVLWGGSFF